MIRDGMVERFEIDEAAQLVLVREGRRTPFPIEDVRLVEPLEPGVNGFVFRGFQKSTGRELAVKVWARRHHDDDRDKVNQGVKEALKASQYPNSVWVFDAGVSKTGHFFAVMEYVAGQRLREWRELANLGLRQAVVRELVRIDREARAAGLFHGDLHDRNIKVLPAEDGRGLRVRIIDPGSSQLARCPDLHQKHLRVLHETIVELLAPFSQARLWEQFAPERVTKLATCRDPVSAPADAAECFSRWHECFLAELPYFLEVLGVFRPLPMPRILVDFSAKYPPGSPVREELMKLEQRYGKEQVAAIAGPPDAWTVKAV
jgi:serine/threonine protein kinase